MKIETLIAFTALVVSMVNLIYFIFDFKRRFEPKFQVIVRRKPHDLASGDFGFLMLVRNRGFAADVEEVCIQKRFTAMLSPPKTIWKGLEEVDQNSTIKRDFDGFQVGVSYVVYVSYNGNMKATCLLRMNLEDDTAISTLS